MDLFWKIVTVAMYIGGSILVCGFIYCIMALFYEFIWKNTLGKTSLFKNKKDDEDEQDDTYNAIFSCAVFMFIILIIFNWEDFIQGVM